MRRSPTLLSLFTVLFFSILCGVGNLHAQVEQKPSEIEAPTTAREAALEREVQVIREYDARMQNTVYWSLGVVVLILILLGGFSWYTNFRLYDRDLNNLRGEIAVAVERASLSLKEESSKALASSIKELSEAQGGFTSTIRKEIDEIDERLGERVTKYSLAQFRYDFLKLHIEFLEFKKANSYVILREYLSLFEVALDIGIDSKVATILDVMELSMKAGTKLYENEIERLVRALDRLPEHLAPKGQRVRVLIADATQGV